MDSNLSIVRIYLDKEIFLLVDSQDYLPAKYVSKFEDKSLSNNQIEYLYDCLRDGSIKWSHLFCMESALDNTDLLLA